MSTPAARLLTEAEYRACFSPPMRDLTTTAEAVVDIWPYVDALDLDALGLPPGDDVSYIYTDEAGLFEHVLIGPSRSIVFLVIIIDVVGKRLVGHYVLDLNELYGLSATH